MEKKHLEVIQESLHKDCFVLTYGIAGKELYYIYRTNAGEGKNILTLRTNKKRTIQFLLDTSGLPAVAELNSIHKDTDHEIYLQHIIIQVVIHVINQDKESLLFNLNKHDAGNIIPILEKLFGKNIQEQGNNIEINLTQKKWLTIGKNDLILLLLNSRAITIANQKTLNYIPGYNMGILDAGFYNDRPYIIDAHMLRKDFFLRFTPITPFLSLEVRKEKKAAYFDKPVVDRTDIKIVDSVELYTLLLRQIFLHIMKEEINRIMSNFIKPVPDNFIKALENFDVVIKNYAYNIQIDWRTKHVPII